MSPRPSVLHVTESFASGVADAIESFARGLPDYDHHLLYATRSEAPADPSKLSAFAEAFEMTAGHGARMSQLSQVADRLGVDLIHAHSSIAGAYARLSGRRTPRPVVYSPHCYAFERRDLGWVQRGGFAAAERLLAGRTAAVAACSERERQLTTRLSRRTVTDVVPNIARAAHGRARNSTSSRRVITAGGRIGPQKDPGLFIDVANAIRAVHPEVEFVWIGGGDARFEQRLLASRITVTGWLSKSESMGELARSSLYVHTAAWEGFPIAILEALQLNVPVAVSRRPYSIGMPEQARFSSAGDVLRLLARLSDSTARKAFMDEWKGATRANTADVQTERLRRLYASALEQVR